MSDKDNTYTISTAEFTETPRLSLEQATGDVYVQGWEKSEIQISTDDGDDYFDVDQSGSQVVVRTRPGRVKFGFEAPDLRGIPGIKLNLEGLGEEMGRRAEEIGRQAESIAARVERKVERSMRRMGRGIDFGIELGRWAGGHDFQIKVPHNCDLTLRTSSGDLHIENVNGTLYANTASGDMRMRSIEGTALFHSASGDIKIEGLSGRLALRTASGDVDILRADMQELSAHTASGDLDLDLVRVPEGGFELKTVSGDVGVSMPRDARLTLQVSTFSGDIDCSLPHDRDRQGHGRERILRINGGGGSTAFFSSVSGDIGIDSNKYGPTQSTPPGSASSMGAPTINMSQAPHQPTPVEDKAEDIMEPEGDVVRQQEELEILQAVERGELSAQDAMRRLGELSNA